VNITAKSGCKRAHYARKVGTFRKVGRLIGASGRFPFLSSPASLFSSPLLEMGPLNLARGPGESCKLPSGVWGGAPAENELGAV